MTSHLAVPLTRDASHRQYTASPVSAVPMATLPRASPRASSQILMPTNAAAAALSSPFSSRHPSLSPFKLDDRRGSSMFDFTQVSTAATRSPSVFESRRPSKIKHDEEERCDDGIFIGSDNPKGNGGIRISLSFLILVQCYLVLALTLVVLAVSLLFKFFAIVSVDVIKEYYLEIAADDVKSRARENLDVKPKEMTDFLANIAEIGGTGGILFDSDFASEEFGTNFTVISRFSEARKYVSLQEDEIVELSVELKALFQRIPSSPPSNQLPLVAGVRVPLWIEQFAAAQHLFPARAFSRLAVAARNGVSVGCDLSPTTNFFDRNSENAPQGQNKWDHPSNADSPVSEANCWVLLPNCSQETAGEPCPVVLLMIPAPWSNGESVTTIIQKQDDIANRFRGLPIFEKPPMFYNISISTNAIFTSFLPFPNNQPTKKISGGGGAAGIAQIRWLPVDDDVMLVVETALDVLQNDLLERWIHGPLPGVAVAITGIQRQDGVGNIETYPISTLPTGTEGATTLSSYSRPLEKNKKTLTITVPLGLEILSVDSLFAPESVSSVPPVAVHMNSTVSFTLSVQLSDAIEQNLDQGVALLVFVSLGILAAICLAGTLALRLVLSPLHKLKSELVAAASMKLQHMIGSSSSGIRAGVGVGSPTSPQTEASFSHQMSVSMYAPSTPMSQGGTAKVKISSVVREIDNMVQAFTVMMARLQSYRPFLAEIDEELLEEAFGEDESSLAYKAWVEARNKNQDESDSDEADNADGLFTGETARHMVRIQLDYVTRKSNLFKRCVTFEHSYRDGDKRQYEKFLAACRANVDAHPFEPMSITILEDRTQVAVTTNRQLEEVFSATPAVAGDIHVTMRKSSKRTILTPIALFVDVLNLILNLSQAILILFSDESTIQERGPVFVFLGFYSFTMIVNIIISLWLLKRGQSYNEKFAKWIAQAGKEVSIILLFTSQNVQHIHFLWSKWSFVCVLHFNAPKVMVMWKAAVSFSYFGFVFCDLMQLAYKTFVIWTAPTKFIVLKSICLVLTLLSLTFSIPKKLSHFAMVRRKHLEPDVDDESGVSKAPIPATPSDGKIDDDEDTLDPDEVAFFDDEPHLSKEKERTTSLSPVTSQLQKKRVKLQREEGDETVEGVEDSHLTNPDEDLPSYFRSRRQQRLGASTLSTRCLTAQEVTLLVIQLQNGISIDRPAHRLTAECSFFYSAVFREVRSAGGMVLYFHAREVAAIFNYPKKLVPQNVPGEPLKALTHCEHAILCAKKCQEELFATFNIHCYAAVTAEYLPVGTLGTKHRKSLQCFGPYNEMRRMIAFSEARGYGIVGTVKCRAHLPAAAHSNDSVLKKGAFAVKCSNEDTYFDGGALMHIEVLGFSHKQSEAKTEMKVEENKINPSRKAYAAPFFSGCGAKGLEEAVSLLPHVSRFAKRWLRRSGAPAPSDNKEQQKLMALSKKKSMRSLKAGNDNTPLLEEDPTWTSDGEGGENEGSLDGGEEEIQRYPLRSSAFILFDEVPQQGEAKGPQESATLTWDEIDAI